MGGARTTLARRPQPRPPLGDRRGGSADRCWSGCAATPEAARGRRPALALAPAPEHVQSRRWSSGAGRPGRARGRCWPAARRRSSLPTLVALRGELLGSLLGARRRAAAALLRLAAGRFDDDRAAGVWRSPACTRFEGDHAARRAYADSARIALEQQLRPRPRTPSSTSSRPGAGVSGPEAEAMREAPSGRWRCASAGRLQRPLLPAPARPDLHAGG